MLIIIQTTDDMKKLLTYLLLLFTGLLPASAQYTFTLNVNWTGNCAGYTGQMNQMIGMYKSQAISGFPTRAQCEQVRSLSQMELGHIDIIWYDLRTGKEVKREATNCKLNVSATPCTGRAMSEAIGKPNALGVSQGTSFYSNNSANEIRDWSEDDIERMLALFKESLPFYELSSIDTGDPIFNKFRDEYEFTGKMPEGSTRFIKKDDDIHFEYPTKGTAVEVPDDFFDKPFVPINMREGGSSTVHSEDFNMLNPDLKPIKPVVSSDETKAGHESDEVTAWYESDDPNVFQYMYSKGKESIQDVSEWWDNSTVGTYVSNTFDVLKDDAIGAAVSSVMPNKMVENAYDTFSTLSGSISNMFQQLDPKTLVNKISKGETLDTDPILKGVSDDVNNLAGRVIGFFTPQNSWNETRGDMEKSGVKWFNNFFKNKE